MERSKLPRYLSLLLSPTHEPLRLAVSALLAVVVVTACQSDSEDGAGASLSRDPTSSPNVPGPSPSVDSSAAPTSGPGTSPDPEAGSLPETTAADGQVLSTLPSVESARATLVALEDCYRRHGLESEVRPDLVLTVLNAEQFTEEELRQIDAACTPEHSTGGMPTPTQEWYEAMYASAVEQVECLAEQGYPIEFDITEQTFIERLKAMDLVAPYRLLHEQYPELEPEDVVPLEAVCPQFVTQ